MNSHTPEDRPTCQATCPGCGAGNAIRASNNLTAIFCGECGWVNDEEWDGPETMREWKDEYREKNPRTVPEQSPEEIREMLRDARDSLRVDGYGAEDGLE